MIVIQVTGINQGIRSTFASSRSILAGRSLSRSSTLPSNLATLSSMLNVASAVGLCPWLKVLCILLHCLDEAQLFSGLTQESRSRRRLKASWSVLKILCQHALAGENRRFDRSPLSPLIPPGHHMVEQPRSVNARMTRSEASSLELLNLHMSDRLSAT